jgi:hypothetical protein
MDDCGIGGDGSFNCGSATCPWSEGAVNIGIRGTFSGTSVSGSFDLAHNTPDPGGLCCELSDITFAASSVPKISIGDVSVIEGHVGTTVAQFDVTLSFGVNKVVTVDWSTADSTADTTDYAASSGTVTFGPQQTSEKIDVLVYGDTEPENNEVFSVNLSNPTNAEIDDGQGQCGITNDDGRPMVTLYDQSDRRSSFSKSSAQDFETELDDHDCEGADDFTVPSSWWRIERVELTGSYSTNGGPAEGVNLRFYRDQGGWPGSTAVCSYTEVVPTSDDSGTPTGLVGPIVVDLPTGCVLSPGTHWLAAQIRMDFDPNKQFYWNHRDRQSGNEAVWRNPGDGWGYGATSWTRLTEVGYYYPEFLFLLAGEDSVPEVFADDFESGDCSEWSHEVP